MLIEQMVIRLTKHGIENNPDYNLTIFGTGHVIYEGKNNVKTMGRAESNIDEDKVIELLTVFKENGFFSLKEFYEIKDAATTPDRIISISISDEDGKMFTKNVSYYNNDPLVPQELKNLEHKIDEIVESDKWVKGSSALFDKTVPVTSQKISKPIKKKPVKAIVGVICVVIAILLIVSAWQYGLFTPTTESLPPTITYITTSLDGTRFNNATDFEQNNTVYLYFEFENITHDNRYNIVEEITASFSIGGEEYSRLTYNYQNDSQNASAFGDNCSFDTNDSWPLGDYRVVFDLNDEISGLTASKEAYFTLYEKIPKIIRRTCANSVSAYKVYTADSIFNINETVFVYLEYTGINTTNDNTVCDISLILNVTSSNKQYYYNIINKITAGDNYAFWQFKLEPDEWNASKFYNVNIDLYDRRTSLVASGSTSFYVS